MILKSVVRYNLIILLCNPLRSPAQGATEIAQATEFTIPSSGAFNLMGVNPALVSRPGFTKDFSIDNFVKDGKLLDNIAMEAQPFWVILFKNKSIKEYNEQSHLARALGNINVSMGTVKKDDLRKFAWSGKITLQNDPMMDRNYIEEIEKIVMSDGFDDKKMSMKIAISALRDKIKLERDTVTIAKLQFELQEKQIELAVFHLQIQDSVARKLKIRATKYIEDHWTDCVMDIGAGQIYTYKTPSLDSIDFSTTGFGIWLNPAMGFKAFKSSLHKIQVAALLKWIQTDGKDDLYAGGNIRYGTSKVNAFVEFVYENNNKKETNTFGYGLTYKIDNKKIIEVGLKHVLDNSLKLKNFYPAVSLNWALAKDVLK